LVKKILTKSSVIGLNTYTSDAKYLGKVVDFGVDLQNPSNVTLIIEGKGKRYAVPVSYIKAAGDIIILAENTPLEELVESKPPAPTSTQPTTATTTATAASSVTALTPSYPVTQQPVHQPSTQQIIPRCATCGAALIYYPQYGRWYCPKCRKYTEVPQAVLNRVPRCPTCGNYLSYIEQYGKWYCYRCGKYVNV